MPASHDLTRLDPTTFEHLVNALAMKVLGHGHTGFGPGPDAGRDGFFEGNAPYPSETDRWSGKWYLQSKFHQPHLSKDPQKWLLGQIRAELDAFNDSSKSRKWPDVWIVATNIEPSGVPMTGAFDKAKLLVRRARPELAERFHIWGGSKIVQLLIEYPHVSEYYRHFLTPGHVLGALYEHLKDNKAEIETVLRHLVVRQFEEQKHTKLEQAGSDADSRPGIHQLFIDIPFVSSMYELRGHTIRYLSLTASKCHRLDTEQPDSDSWRKWRKHPSRARVWFVRGGPGQGKSTIGQYFCQLQRAALILQDSGPRVLPAMKELAEEVRSLATAKGQWPAVPRIPVQVELRDFAQWIGKRKSNEARGILTYIAERIAVGVEQEVSAGTLKRALACRGWFFLFDGLDEVPQDVKDSVACEVRHFVDEVSLEIDADLLTVCTSRPQGYAGQFDDLDGPTIDLSLLNREEALECARPVLALGRSEAESARSFQVLANATASPSVAELMTTALQAHIMAVVVRDGGRPPERRWQLYTNFYDVIKRREANRDLPDVQLARLLREDTQLLKTVHNRLGYLLHARAETSAGAQTSLSREEFEKLVTKAVRDMVENNTAEKVRVLMEATTDRLVLVSTPDDGHHLRFDIRPLQEFFAAEYLYEQVDAEELRRRVELIAGDAHWREVTHFLLSALVENGRRTELSAAIEVLDHLNEGDKGETGRILLRRLCRGGLVSARLLQEGVLEQDKRVRQEFRHTLVPLLALTHIKSIEILECVQQVNSKLWLRSFLLDHLREADVTECFGALLALLRILPDNDPATQDVHNYFLSAPTGCRSALLQALNPHMRTNSARPVKDWVLRVVLDTLCASDWWRLEVGALNSAILLLQIDAEQTIRVAAVAHERPYFGGVLKCLLDKRDWPVEVEADYGILKKTCIAEDWTAAAHKFPSLSIGECDTERNVPGLFAFICSICTFATRRSRQSLIGVLSALHKSPHLLGALPRWVVAQIPCIPDNSLALVVNKLNGMDDKAFTDALTSKSIAGVCLERHSMIDSMLNTKGQLPDTAHLMKLATNMPDIAILLWKCDFYMPWSPLSGVEKNQDLKTAFLLALIDGFANRPAALLKVPWAWGTIFDAEFDRQDELWKAMLEKAGDCEPEGYLMGAEFRCVPLCLPAEAALLPHVLSALLRTIQHRSHCYSGADMKDTICSAAKDICQKQEDVLLEITGGITFPLSVRCAALLISILKAKSFANLGQGAAVLRAGYDSGRVPWLLEAVVSVFSLFDSETDEGAQAVIASLLLSAKHDYRGRQTLQRLLQFWRENSKAPLQAKGNAEAGLLDAEV